MEVHCKDIACKKGNFSLSFISHVLSMHFLCSRNTASQWMYKGHETTALNTSFTFKKEMQ